MDEIKAIETHYRGRRFRSRLEARWAVFFDFMDIEWEYEPEAFVLPSGACYLPDFRITYPRGESGPCDFWVEVKRPAGDVPDSTLVNDAKKVYELAMAQSMCVLYLDGAPDFRLYSLACRMEYQGVWNFWEDEAALWSKNSRPWYSADNWDVEWLKANPTYRAAVTAALSARFERAGEVQVIADVLPGGRLSQLLRQGGIHEPS